MTAGCREGKLGFTAWCRSEGCTAWQGLGSIFEVAGWFGLTGALNVRDLALTHIVRLQLGF